MANKKSRKGTGRRGRPRKKNTKDVSQVVRDEIIGILLIGLACLGFVLLFTEGGGVLGSKVMNILQLISGEAVVFILLGIAVCGFLIMSNKNMLLRNHIIGIISFWIVIASLMHLSLGVHATMETAYEGKGGGMVGGAVVYLLVKAIGRNGSYVVLIMVGIISLMLVFNQSLIQICKRVGGRLANGASRIGTQLNDFGNEIFSEEKQSLPEEPTKSKVRKKGTREADPVAAMTPSAKKAKTKSWPYQYFTGDYAPEIGEEIEVITFDENKNSDEDLALAQEEFAAKMTLLQEETGKTPPPDKNDKTRPKDQAGQKDQAHQKDQGRERQLVQSTPISRQSVQGKAYKLPGLNLLNKLSKENKSHLNKSINESAKTLEETLANFGVTVKVVRVTQGPAITRFELQPAPGIKVSRITSLSDDIALALAASNVRIEAPIPGRSVVGIEVPNQEISPVHFREVIESSEFKSMPSKTTLALGKDISGNTIVGDLGKMPHLLIAGATGSGKSVCINSIICSILFKACPDEVKMLLIDPKMVELINYNGAPHLVAPVVVDPQKAAGALKWMVTEMDSRYELFARAGVRDIVRYNFLVLEQEEKDKRTGKGFAKDETVLALAAKQSKEDAAGDGSGQGRLGLDEPGREAAKQDNLGSWVDEGLDGSDKPDSPAETEADPASEFSTGVLPYVVIIIDELADLMMVAPADVEDSICRLAQMARAAGMHLIVATQRPSVDVITGLIKANIPSRIAFAVSSQIDSRTILDMAGAEKLLGRGDMLYSNMSIAKPIRVQGCFLDDREVKNIVDFWKEQALPKYLEIPEGNLKVLQNEEPEDELFYKAVQIIIDSNTASVSYLQRRLKIGYTRAARLMDSLEEKGVVGKSEGAKPRDILMTRGIFEQRFGKWHDN